MKTHRLFVMAFVMMGFLLASVSTFAAPLPEYLKAIEASRTNIKAHASEEQDFSQKETVEAASIAFKQISDTLIEFKEVEHAGQTVEVDNSWVEQARKSFENEKDLEEKKQILDSVGDRLESILTKLKTLTVAGQRETSKDEEKRRLAKILEREEFGAAEESEESPAAKLYRLITEWLRSIFPQMEPVAPQQTADLSLLRGALQIIIFLLVAAIIVYVVIRFGPLVLKRVGKREKKRRKQLILGEEIGPDATTEDLFAQAEQLALAGDIRGAIRKGYISLLFELSQRKLIGLAKHKTNRDYLRDLPRNEQLRDDVTGLTVNYERHWYGRKEAESPEWEEFKQGYRKALNTG